MAVNKKKLRSKEGLKGKGKPTNTKLDFVDPDEDDVKLKAVIYGKPGTGKTLLSTTFPKPLLLVDINGEEGYIVAKRVKGVKVVRVKTPEDLYNVYWMLKEKEGKYKTVVIDTTSNVQDLFIEDLRVRKKPKVAKEKIGNWGTMTKSDWGEIGGNIKSLILDFRELDMNVIFLAQERVFNVDDEDGDDRIEPSVGPKLMPSVSSTMMAAVDVVGNTFIRERVGKKTTSMQYCLRVGPHPYYTTKIRVPRDQEVPSFLIDTSYDDIIDLIEGDE